MTMASAPSDFGDGKLLPGTLSFDLRISGNETALHSSPEPIGKADVCAYARAAVKTWEPAQRERAQVAMQGRWKAAEQGIRSLALNLSELAQEENNTGT